MNAKLQNRIHDDRKKRLDAKIMQNETRKLKETIKEMTTCDRSLEDEFQATEKMKTETGKLNIKLNAQLTKKCNQTNDLKNDVKSAHHSNSAQNRRKDRVHNESKLAKNIIFNVKKETKKIQTKLVKVEKKKKNLIKKNRRIKLSTSRIKDKTHCLKERVKITTEENKELHLELELKLTESELNVVRVRREPYEKNTMTWPLAMAKVTIEMLTHGTPPSTVTKNVETVLRLLCPNVLTIELTNIDCVRKCRGIVRIVGETCAAHELSKNRERVQTFNDETQRRTVPLTEFSRAIMKDGKTRYIVMSCS